MAQVRCRKCNCSFEPNNLMYSGRDFCPDCRDKPQQDVIASEKESYEQYRKMGYTHEQASQKAYEYAQGVARERAKRGQ